MTLASGSHQPPLVCIYGPPGIGKTTDTGYSFPQARFYAERNALASIRSVCGYEPDERPMPKDITFLTQDIRNIKPGEVHQVVVDDFSHLAEKTVDSFKAKFSGFVLWGKVREALLEFRTVARNANCLVVLNTWEALPQPKSEDRDAKKGGPSLPGRMRQEFPAMCDLVLRGGINAMRKPWGGVYLCDLKPDWVMKDRFDVATRIHPIPMNLAELLRATGFDMPRHPQLEWQEGVVEAVAAELQGAAAHQVPQLANQWFADLRDRGVPPAVCRWTIRDALDRSVIRRALHQAESKFI